MNCRALKRGTKICGAAIAVFGFALAANAQEAPEDTTPPATSPPASEEQPPAEKLPPCPMPEQAQAPAPIPPPPPAPVAEKKHNIVFAPQEVAITTGAGVANYFGTPTNGTMDPGAGWDARLTFGTRSILALEAAYIGSSNNIDTVSGNHGQVSSNGLDGDFRVQLPYAVQPYIFSGVGYNHMAITRTDSVTLAGPVNNSDDQLTVPAGGGLAGYIGKHTTLDLRGTYRYIPDNGITIMNSRALHQWVAQAHVGYVF
ncbi:MAG TPA: hypothetical protein VN947_36365 [Polyangia bacterium]|nr:hypothetical protein [Polyangia bacterium]